MKNKIEVLKKYLQTEEIKFDYNSYTQQFIIGNDTYYVLTEEEAEELVRERIKESLWCISSEFIEHETGFDAEIIGMVQQRMCENSNKFVKALIEASCGLEKFMNDIIEADGRGIFLTYDGHESIEKINGETYYIYS